jgi:uncharacterized protein
VSEILRPPAQALDPRVRTMWATTSVLAAMGAAAATVVTVLVLASTDESTAAWIAGGVGTALTVSLLAATALRVTVEFRNYRYEVTQLGLYVSHGWLWRRWQIVPHSRVQTVDTKAGPLHRLFGLVAIHVTTASASGGTTIPGLSLPVAAELIQELARHAELDEGT